MYAQSSQDLMDLPWVFRAAIGHFMPLLLAIYCTYSLRAYAKDKHAVLTFLVVLFANGTLCFQTVTALKTAVLGGYLVAVQFMPAVQLMLVLVVASAVPKKLAISAVVAGTFWPIYVVDIYCSHKVFGPEWLPTMRALGGAGPLDGLVLVPAIAVTTAWLVARIRARLGIN